MKIHDISSGILLFFVSNYLYCIVGVPKIVTQKILSPLISFKFIFCNFVNTSYAWWEEISSACFRFYIKQDKYHNFP